MFLFVGLYLIIGRTKFAPCFYLSYFLHISCPHTPYSFIVRNFNLPGFLYSHISWACIDYVAAAHIGMRNEDNRQCLKQKKLYGSHNIIEKPLPPYWLSITIWQAQLVDAFHLSNIGLGFRINKAAFTTLAGTNTTNQNWCVKLPLQGMRVTMKAEIGNSNQNNALSPTMESFEHTLPSESKTRKCELSVCYFTIQVSSSYCAYITWGIRTNEGRMPPKL